MYRDGKPASPAFSLRAEAIALLRLQEHRQNSVFRDLRTLMPYASALSHQRDASAAVAEVAGRIEQGLSFAPDLVLVFFSRHHVAAAERIAVELKQRLAPGALLGCSAEGVIGNEEEVDQGPGLVVWAGRWASSMHSAPFRLHLEETADGFSLLGWPDELLNAEPGNTTILVFGDPFTFPVELLLNQLNEDYPGVPLVGGMASAARSPGQNRLLLGDQVHLDGAVGVILQGAVPIGSIVSQGCRPIGRPMVITRAQDQVIQELGGVTPLRRLQELWSQLSPDDQTLLQQGLHIGRVIDEYREQFKPGDFLVRNVQRLSQETGALEIGESVRVGQTVQFHVRDAASAHADLHQLLRQYPRSQPRPPAAALLFSCNGRGRRMFEALHHDARAIQTELGRLPVAGFFAAGELGPVGGRNFIHGFTASIVLFQD